MFLIHSQRLIANTIYDWVAYEYRFYNSCDKAIPKWLLSNSVFEAQIQCCNAAYLFRTYKTVFLGTELLNLIRSVCKLGVIQGDAGMIVRAITRLVTDVYILLVLASPEHQTAFFCCHRSAPLFWRWTKHLMSARVGSLLNLNLSVGRAVGYSNTCMNLQSILRWQDITWRDSLDFSNIPFKPSVNMSVLLALLISWSYKSKTHSSKRRFFLYCMTTFLFTTSIGS